MHVIISLQPPDIFFFVTCQCLHLKEVLTLLPLTLGFFDGVNITEVALLHLLSTGLKRTGRSFLLRMLILDSESISSGLSPDVWIGQREVIESTQPAL